MLLLAALWFAAATAADCATTHVALRRGLREGNGIADKLFGKHVVLGAALASAAYLAFAVWAGLVAQPPALGIAAWTLAILGAGHAVAAVSNARKIRRGRA